MDAMLFLLLGASWKESHPTIYKWQEPYGLIHQAERSV